MEQPLQAELHLGLHPGGGLLLLQPLWRQHLATVAQSCCAAGVSLMSVPRHAMHSRQSCGCCGALQVPAVLPRAAQALKVGTDELLLLAGKPAGRCCFQSTGVAAQCASFAGAEGGGR